MFIMYLILCYFMKDDFKQRISDEMTVDYSNALEKNFDLAKQFLRITRDGKVDVLVKNRARGVDAVGLYLIGKLYAKEAGFVVTDAVGNKELAQELGIPMGSLFPWLKELRDANIVKALHLAKNEVQHTMLINMVERVLKGVEQRLKDQEQENG